MELTKDILEANIQELGFSDEDAARLLDVSRPTIARWRKGLTTPHPDMQRGLITILHKEWGRRQLG